MQRPKAWTVCYENGDRELMITWGWKRMRRDVWKPVPLAWSVDMFASDDEVEEIEQMMRFLISR